MARSEEALQRRAAKRQRTLEEQRKVDLEDIKRQKSQAKKFPLPQNEGENPIDPMKEAGAWKCQQCGNENFASRRWCNSKTCNEPRPSHIVAPPRRQSLSSNKSQQQRRRDGHPLDEPGAWACGSCGSKNFASREVCYNRSCLQPRLFSTTPLKGSNSKSNPRHDEATSKKLIWASQADRSTIEKNQELRRRYLDTGGEGMELQDIERAKILIARDERKKRKKEPKEQVPVEEAKLNMIVNETDNEKSKRDRNKALRKLYKETGGKGMKPEMVERAKQLIERDERKRQKRQKLSSQ